MKKTKLSLVIICFCLVSRSYAQNIGIGTTTPTRAKLELHGSVDATCAIFGGESTGMSLMRNWPGVGFNNYWNAGDRYIGNGFAAKQYLDPFNGYMAFDMFPNGVANGLASSSLRAILLTQEGRLGIGNSGYPDATLSVARGNGAGGTAIFQGTSNYSYFNYGNNENTY